MRKAVVASKRITGTPTPHPSPSPQGEGLRSPSIRTLAISKEVRNEEVQQSLLKVRSRSLRQSSTDAESLMWRYLRSRRLQGYKFRRQVPIGNYIVDFLCEEASVIVELDGGQHMDHHEYDETRSKWLASQGFEVVRFWNNEVLQQTEPVLERLYSILQTRVKSTP